MPASLKLMKGIGTNNYNTYDTSHEFSMTNLDSANILAANAPIGRPAFAAINYSYESWLFLKVETAPENSLTNFRFWSSGNDPAIGVKMFVGSAYASATPTINPSTKASTSAAWYNDPGNSLQFCNKNLTVANDYTSFLVMQLRIDSTAPLGTLYNSACVFHYSYDES